jgi:hypothetical protein
MQVRYRAALHPEFPCPAFRSDPPAPRRDALPGCATPRVPLSRISKRPSRPKAGCATGLRYTPRTLVPHFEATLPPQGGMRYRAALHPEFPCPAFRSDHPATKAGCATGLRYTPSSLVPHFAATIPPQGGMRYRAALHPEFPCPAFRSDHPAPRRDALPGCATPRVPLSRISQRPSRPKAGCATGLRYTPSSLVPHFVATLPPQGGMRYRAVLYPEFPCPAFRSDHPAPRRDALPGCATPEFPCPAFRSDHPALRRDALPGCATPRVPLSRNGRECKQRRTADDRKTKSGHGAAFR